MKTPVAFLLVGLLALIATAGCNGAETVVGPPDDVITPPVTTTVTPRPRPRPTPDPCGFDPTLCA